MAHAPDRRARNERRRRCSRAPGLFEAQAGSAGNGRHGQWGTVVCLLLGAGELPEPQLLVAPVRGGGS